MASYLLSRDKSGKIHIEKLHITVTNAPNTGAGPYDALPSAETLAALEASNAPLPSWESGQKLGEAARREAMSVRIILRHKPSRSWARAQFHLAETLLKIFR